MATLKGFNNIGEHLLSDNLSANIQEFFNWGLLEMGGFTNVRLSTSGAYGGDKSRLRLVDEPNYTLGQVWEGHRHNWVWESGVPNASQPVQVSGTWVDGVFYGLNHTGVYKHHVDYPKGQIVFDAAISTSATVRAEYSYRYYNFYSSNEPWFAQLQYNSFRIDKPAFLQQSSGDYAILSQNRVQLPAVIVEVMPDRRMRGLELGGGQWVAQNVLFHVISETPWERSKIVDIITYQKEKSFMTFNLNRMSDANAFPLTYNGSIALSGKCYPDLIRPTGEAGFLWRKVFIKDMNAEATHFAPGTFSAVAQGIFEVDMPGL